jgi:molybdopterin converting factor small subunit
MRPGKVMQVLIPNPLRSYTNDASVVNAQGTSLAELVADLDRRFPGIQFRIVDEHGRIRRHIKFFVNRIQVQDLQPPLESGDEVMIVCALSGG